MGVESSESAISDSFISNEVQAEFITNITDSKYHLAGKNLYSLPTTVTSDDLNEMLSNLLSLSDIKFTFFCFNIRIDGTIAQLLEKIEFSSESTLTITYTLLGDSKSKSLYNLNSWVTCLKYLNNQLVISSADGTISSINCDEGNKILNTNITDGEIASFDIYNHDNNIYIGTISSYGHVEIALISSGKCSYNSIAHFKGHSNSGTGIKFSPQFNFLATVGYDRAVRIFSTDNITNADQIVNLGGTKSDKRTASNYYNKLEEKEIYWGHSDAITSIDCVKADLIKTVSLDSTYRLWDVESSKCKHTINLSKPATCIDINSNDISSIGHMNGLVSIFDDRCEGPVFREKIHSRIVSDVKWNDAYGNIFATTSNDGSTIVYDLRFNKLPLFTHKDDKLDAFIRACSWISGSDLATGSSKGEITRHVIQNLVDYNA